MEFKTIFGLTLLSVLFWTLFYACVQWKKQKDEFSSRVIAGSHALVMIIYCGYLLKSSPSPFSEPGGETTSEQEIAIIISLGYFIYDLGWCLYYQPDGRIMLIHHLLAIACFTTALIMRVSGAEAVEALFFLEFSNPLLQARWFIRAAGYKQRTKIFMTVDLLFLFTFSIIRLVGGTFYTYSYLKNPKPLIVFKLLALMLYLLSWGFGLYMGQYFYAKYIRRSRTPHDIEPGAQQPGSQEVVNKSD